MKYWQALFIGIAVAFFANHAAALELSKINAKPNSANYFRTHCPDFVASGLKGCMPEQFASPGVFYKAFAYGIYSVCKGAEGDRVCTKTLVVFASLTSKDWLDGWPDNPDAPLTPLYSTSYETGTAGDIEPPRIIYDPHSLLLIRYDWAGTAHASEDALLDLRTLTPIDNRAWAKSIHIPEGLQSWHGATVDYEHLTGSMYLFREHDANCCPTGGVIDIKFAIENSKLVVKDQTFVPYDKKS